VAAGQRMPGVIHVSQSLPVGRAIEDLVLIVTCGVSEDLEGRITFLPL
jgi:hypothetical protein